ncbi:uncharacterized protein BP01DRAFT_341902 [Aspergillus saccharolyticus JOP 1030-1]|uniref:Thioredoxin domain-containing protein n=1 Tax=Aspergillus saccharolyticus JOP 1030-1 TaxID=1450539 RepID=A0A318ZBB8_9EURO|nr:hypothetical protein BP01DRAFT_341902 [Aspergillus saccharolyticus JOP 1030-1]PYH44666.1 hypothetical protein BP01DRAFT_341902 [Aspergillus saccharolyticus JOP 1030-1]
MTFSTELASWLTPAPGIIPTATPPELNHPAPSSPELPIPASNGHPTVILFLRHCGCPVAEADFRNLRQAASQHPDINFTAISHSDEPATTRWVDAVGGPGAVKVIVDVERRLYAAWGLGVVSWSHVLSLAALVNIMKLGRERGIWNRNTESGSRWQAGGFWAVDAQGVVRWGRPARRADDFLDVEGAVRAVCELRVVG